MDALGVKSSGGGIRVTRPRGRAPRVVLSGRPLRMAKRRGIVRWHVSLTHDGDLAAALAIGCPENSPVRGAGIDLTRVARIRRMIATPAALDRFKKRILHPSEEKLLKPSKQAAIHLARLWALKEAAYKALPHPKPHFLACQKGILVSGHPFISAVVEGQGLLLAVVVNCP